jgi:hypothetical protein
MKTLVNRFIPKSTDIYANIKITYKGEEKGTIIMANSASLKYSGRTLGSIGDKLKFFHSLVRG